MDPKTLASIERRVAAAENELAVIWPSGKIIATGEPGYIEQVRRANLLIRSKKFMAEGERVFGLLRKAPLKKKEPRFQKAWQNFCYRWEIDGFWDGDPTELHLNASRAGEVYIKEQSGKIASVPFYGCGVRGRDVLFPCSSTRWPRNICKEPTFVYLKLAPQTGLREVKRIWPVVEILKARAWKTSGRKKRTFGRDLMLFDLKYEPLYGPLSYGQLARDYNMSKAKVQQACKRIKESIGRLGRP